MSESRHSSPAFGWFSAGAGLVVSQLDCVIDKLNNQLERSKDTFEALQEKGKEVDAQLKSVMQPTPVIQPIASFVSALPVAKCFAFSSSSKKHQQIDALSQKVDVLIEQVAVLAAKKAAQKAAPAVSRTPKPKATQLEPEAKKAPKPATRRKSTPTATRTKTATARKTTRATSPTKAKPSKPAPPDDNS